MRKESCGLSISEITQPSGPLTTMRHRAALVVEGHRDIGLVVLPAQDRNRDRAEFPSRGLDQEIIGLAPRGYPRTAESGIEELSRGLNVARQALGKFRRAAAVMGIDVADQRFRRFE